MLFFAFFLLFFCFFPRKKAEKKQIHSHQKKDPLSQNAASATSKTVFFSFFSAFFLLFCFCFFSAFFLGKKQKESKFIPTKKMDPLRQNGASGTSKKRTKCKKKEQKRAKKKQPGSQKKAKKMGPKKQQKKEHHTKHCPSLHAHLPDLPSRLPTFQPSQTHPPVNLHLGFEARNWPHVQDTPELSCFSLPYVKINPC